MEKTQGFSPKAEDPVPKACAPLVLASVSWRPLGTLLSPEVPATEEASQTEQKPFLQQASSSLLLFGKHKIWRHYNGQVLSSCWVLILELAIN